MARPVIGITTYVTPAKWSYWDTEAALIPADYVYAVERAGGRALMDAAAARPEPIPVYAEMGSINPVFILGGALEQNAEALVA